MSDDTNSDLMKAQEVVAPLPGKATEGGHDVIFPTVKVLTALNLLSDKSSEGFADAFTGPPSSVALLEAGATAAAKWWSVAGAAAFAGTWAAVRGFWDGNSAANQRMLLISAAIVSAAIIVAIGYLLACDVRGRAAAMVATIEARSRVAQSIAQAAGVAAPNPVIGASKPRVDGSTSAANERQIVHITGRVRYFKVPQENEPGWSAIAMSAQADGSDVRFYIGKDGRYEWVSPTDVKFDGATA